MKQRALVITCVCLLAGSTGVAGEDTNWERIPVEDVFRSEGVAAADINKDRLMDVIHGEAWYEAPHWTRHEIRKLGTYNPATGYSNSFANWVYDVNGDGWMDLICVGFPGKECHWYENPKNEPGHWKEHLIWHSACNETPQFVDVTGDGRPELILGSQPEGQMGYLEIPAPDKATQKWNFVPVSEEKSIGTDRFYHGLGVGDLNGDGRLDILIPHGWWEQPESLGTGLWKFRPLTLTKDGKGTSLPAADIHVYDLDLDGDQDILMSSPHGHGIWWFENTGTNSEPKFEYRLIDETFSQTHALHLVDLNGDGTKDLVTGKRFYAHGPKGDADPLGEVVMYWYEIRRAKGMPPTFVPHKIVAGTDTGIGTQFQITDFNGDGTPDIILSNKKGTNVLLQKRKP